MKKICLIVLLFCSVVACGGAKKPPLSPTQVVDGKSIIIPPEFDIIPDESSIPAKPQKAEKEE